MTAAALHTADWGEQSRWQWKDLSCHWRVIGSDQGLPPVLLLHGWRQRATGGTAPLLAASGFRVHALDLIGFGASDHFGWNPRRPWTTDFGRFKVLRSSAG